MSKAVPLLVALILVCALVAILWVWRPQAERGIAQESIRPRDGDFVLESARGVTSLAGLRGNAVLIYFISVDPRRDSPERLETYAADCHPSILGLTGRPQDPDRVAHPYGAACRISKTDPRGEYLVDHSAATYLVETLGYASSSAQVLAAI